MPENVARTGLRRGLKSLGALNELGVLLALIGLIAVIAISHPNFLSFASLINVAQGASIYGMIALGMVFLLAMREIDLSVGANYGLSIMAAAMLITSWGWDPWIAAGASVILSMALGAFNGVLANALAVPAIIVTLGTLSAYRGATLVLSGGRYTPSMPESSFFDLIGSRWLGVPASIWVLGMLTVLLTFVFRFTRFGFVVRAIGSNEQAARLSGIPIRRVRLITLTMVGGICGIAGMLTFAFFESADTNFGSGYELLVIAAAIIGGTGLSGGSGSVLGALVGALLISTIQSGLVQFGVDPNWSSLVTGAVIIAAVAVDSLVKRRRSRTR
ncbi:MAG: ABC transporter permease [Pseudolysinimonas sp.]|uniref:ABC transporter permease n=1 Tax=Pseudolysinimonas sp. TaxID=2680009 RepID=UPI003C754FFF